MAHLGPHIEVAFGGREASAFIRVEHGGLPGSFCIAEFKT